MIIYTPHSIDTAISYIIVHQKGTECNLLRREGEGRCVTSLLLVTEQIEEKEGRCVTSLLLVTEQINHKVKKPKLEAKKNYQKGNVKIGNIHDLQADLDED